jgi:hypothetical protein
LPGRPAPIRPPSVGGSSRHGSLMKPAGGGALPPPLIPSLIQNNGNMSAPPRIPDRPSIPARPQ